MGNQLKKEYDISAQIGSGGPFHCFKIYSAISKANGEKFSLFILSKKAFFKGISKKNKTKFLTKLRSGITYQNTLVHESILKIRPFSEEKLFLENKSNFCFLTDPIQYSLSNLEGNFSNFESKIPEALTSLVSEEEEIDLVNISCGLHEITKALHSLHQHKKVHLNLNPTSIYITNTGDWKLSDFCFCENENTKSIIDSKMYSERIFPQPCLDYLAPECIFEETCSSKSDSFSLSCLIYYLINKSLLINSNNNNVEQYKQRLNWIQEQNSKHQQNNNDEEQENLSQVAEFLEELPKKLWDPMVAMLESSTTSRISAEAFLQMPYFENSKLNVLNYLTILSTQTSENKSEFLTQLLKFLSHFPNRTCTLRIIPSLVKETRSKINFKNDEGFNVNLNITDQKIVLNSLKCLFWITENILSNSEFTRLLFDQMEPLFLYAQNNLVELLICENLSLILSKLNTEQATQTILPFIQRILDSNKWKTQEVLLNKSSSFVTLVSPELFRKQLLPKFISACLNVENFGIRVKYLISLNEIVFMFDNQIISNEILPLFEKLLIMEKAPAIIMSILGISLTISKESKIDFYLFTERFFSLFLPLTKENGLNKNQFYMIFNFLKKILKLVEHRRLQEFQLINNSEPIDNKYGNENNNNNNNDNHNHNNNKNNNKTPLFPFMNQNINNKGQNQLEKKISQNEINLVDENEKEIKKENQDLNINRNLNETETENENETENETETENVNQNENKETNDPNEPFFGLMELNKENNEENEEEEKQNLNMFDQIEIKNNERSENNNNENNKIDNNENNNNGIENINSEENNNQPNEKTKTPVKIGLRRVGRKKKKKKIRNKNLFSKDRFKFNQRTNSSSDSFTMTNTNEFENINNLSRTKSENNNSFDPLSQMNSNNNNNSNDNKNDDDNNENISMFGDLEMKKKSNQVKIDEKSMFNFIENNNKTSIFDSIQIKSNTNDKSNESMFNDLNISSNKKNNINNKSDDDKVEKKNNEENQSSFNFLNSNISDQTKSNTNDKSNESMFNDLNISSNKNNNINNKSDGDKVEKKNNEENQTSFNFLNSNISDQTKSQENDKSNESMFSDLNISSNKNNNINNKSDGDKVEKKNNEENQSSFNFLNSNINNQITTENTLNNENMLNKLDQNSTENINNANGLNEEEGEETESNFNFLNNNSKTMNVENEEKPKQNLLNEKQEQSLVDFISKTLSNEKKSIDINIKSTKNNEQSSSFNFLNNDNNELKNDEKETEEVIVKPKIVIDHSKFNFIDSQGNLIIEKKENKKKETTLILDNNNSSSGGNGNGNNNNNNNSESMFGLLEIKQNKQNNNNQSNSKFNFMNNKQKKIQDTQQNSIFDLLNKNIPNAIEKESIVTKNNNDQSSTFNFLNNNNNQEKDNTFDLLNKMTSEETHNSHQLSPKKQQIQPKRRHVSRRHLKLKPKKKKEEENQEDNLFW
ncbi:scy1-like protein [Anaeramoeba flamelloides]|uniref:Scy1-like protein n=1 Tax=Anaeramoeba flamelloides TaxID=1746091 RepID=A0ABQ8XFW5_9EUKA|nr:scy1-like protein [Anaeramoeba flamelloides]